MKYLNLHILAFMAAIGGQLFRSCGQKQEAEAMTFVWTDIGSDRYLF